MLPVRVSHHVLDNEFRDTDTFIYFRQWSLSASVGIAETEGPSCFLTFSPVVPVHCFHFKLACFPGMAGHMGNKGLSVKDKTN